MNMFVEIKMQAGRSNLFNLFLSVVNRKQLRVPYSDNSDRLLSNSQWTKFAFRTVQSWIMTYENHSFFHLQYRIKCTQFESTVSTIHFFHIIQSAEYTKFTHTVQWNFHRRNWPAIDRRPGRGFYVKKVKIIYHWMSSHVFWVSS